MFKEILENTVKYKELKSTMILSSDLIPLVF